MTDAKHVLIVDDHFEMLEFLRSMLELSNPAYHVLGVPSAEEGLLELHRTPYDLLITDVRLPGMSGFELVRKARKLRTGLPVLMITAYATSQGRMEAEELGVYRYFEKPLDTDALLAAVHVILVGGTSDRSEESPPAVTKEAVVNQAPVDIARAVVQLDTAERPRGEAPKQEITALPQEAEKDRALKHRLHGLLSDTGAVEALLAGSDGRILYRVGNSAQPVAKLSRLLARNMASSFELAAALRNTEPFTIQYQAGKDTDLYTANIGRDYFLILIFDARARRGRIGTVWVFAQRAIKELRVLLAAAVESEVYEGDDAAADNRTEAAAAGVVESTLRKDEAGVGQTQPPTLAREAELDAGDDALLDLLSNAGTTAPDLDSFWEEAAADAGTGSGSGLSFEEAVRRGLLPPDLSH